MGISLQQQFTPARIAAPRRFGWALIGDMIALRRQRNQLRKLDDRLLDDIGVTRYAAQQESAKILWDVPGFWRS